MARRLGQVLEPIVSPTSPLRSLDTIRALCHDLRQPLVVILMLAGARGNDVQHRLDVIGEEARWVLDVVEAVIGGAADDSLGDVEVVDLVAHCVERALPTAQCDIRLIGTDRAMAVAVPVALNRAISCLLDNAMRAAGVGGHVTVAVNSTNSEVPIRVADDGPGFGHVPTNNSLGLTITRALVSTCGGAFDLRAGTPCGVVARIVLPPVSATAMST
jgi:signal transduction histidine kinase